MRTGQHPNADHPPAVSTSVEGAAQREAHTPGPWRVSENAVTDQILTIECDPISGLGQWRVATVRAANEPVGKANARLIAAAPDMLAALKEIAEGKGRFNRDPLIHASNCIDDMKAIASAAIAKAEGRS